MLALVTSPCFAAIRESFDARWPTDFRLREKATARQAVDLPGGTTNMIEIIDAITAARLRNRGERA